MYETYFGLTERPFSIAPDPQYLYMSKRHKEAMAHLSYGLTQGGCFIVLTGEVGTGKTTLCRNLLSELPSNVDVALILNANINEVELLQSICDELKISYTEQSSQKKLLDSINQHLLQTFAENRHTVLIIDEAQLLSRDVLEQIRLLTNLETTKSKLLQIILIGQPELNELLKRNDLRQLAQRVTARYHLGALHQTEIEDYVNFRLSVAGCKQPLFSRQALNKLHKLTEGIPRKINVLADHALLATYAKTASLVDAKTVTSSASDVFIELSETGSGAKSALASNALSRWAKWVYVAVAIIALNIFLWWAFGTAKPNGLGPNVADKEPAISMNEVVVDPVPKQRSSIEQPAIDNSNKEQSAEASMNNTIVDLGEKEPAETGSVIFSDVPLDNSPNLPKELRDAFSSVASSGEDVAAPAAQLQQQTQEPVDSPLARLLEASADKTGRIEAFRRLADRWGETLPAQLIQPVCELLLDENLRCLGFQDWAQWQRYNRPAVLVLNHQQQLHRVLVTGLNDERATLVVGEQTLEVRVQELRQMWVGQGVVFIRTLPSGSPFLQLGDSGPSVISARKRLNQVLSLTNLPTLRSENSPDFDMDMAQKLFALQTRFNIVPDSKIGNETWLLIDELLGESNQLTLRSRV